MIKVSLSGIKGLEKALKDKSEALTKSVSNEIKASVEKINDQQKTLAPKNYGALAGSLKWAPVSQLHFELVSRGAGSSYAPYVEFGTGTKVSIPKGLESVAATYKGAKGGTFSQMITELKDWCRKKGIPESAAYPIAVKILREGVRPQPFFFAPAFAEWNKLKKRIENMLKK
jgi:putative transposon-encoded protein